MTNYWREYQNHRPDSGEVRPQSIKVVTLVNWSTPPIETQKIDSGDLHLWHFSLDQGPTNPDQLLSRDERSRIQQIKHPETRSRTQRARAYVRTVLSQYLDLAPQQIEFKYGELGKPMLANGDRPLQFNLSHSQNQALLVICSQAEVGVDIEPLRRQPAALKIARRVMDSSSVSELERLSEPALSEVFIQRWTQMEAMAKAHGGGVFSWDKDTDRLNTHQWSPFEGWCAAVAVAGPMPIFEDWKFFSASHILDHFSDV